MSKHNEKNERLKYKYTGFLKHSRGKSDSTIDKALAAIDRYQEVINYRNFGSFKPDWAIEFKDCLEAERNKRTKKPLAAGTIVAILKEVKAFHKWLADQEGYRSKIRYSDADYFNPSNRQVQIAKDAGPKKYPSPEEIRHVLKSMSSNSPIQKRNRALIACLFMTGMRVGALVGVKLKHVNLVDGSVHHDARDMHTKFSKSSVINFFPVGDDVVTIFEDYVIYLREVLLFSPEDPLFPKTNMLNAADGSLKPSNLKREHWSGAGPVRDIVAKAFISAGLPKYGPHSFRHTLGHLGQTMCKTPEDFNAWSQNSSHNDVLTTLRSYGQLSNERKSELMKGLRAAS